MINSSSLQWVSGGATPDKILITRIFNFGTLEEWRQMKQRYSDDQILEALKNPLKGQWMRRAKRFAEVLYEVRMPPEVLISYDA